MRATIGALIACVTLFIIFFAFSLTMSTLTNEIEDEVANMSFSPERTYDDMILSNHENFIRISNILWSIFAIGALINIILIREEEKGGFRYFER